MKWSSCIWNEWCISLEEIGKTPLSSSSHSYQQWLHKHLPNNPPSFLPSAVFMTYSIHSYYETVSGGQKQSIYSTVVLEYNFYVFVLPFSATLYSHSTTFQWKLVLFTHMYMYMKWSWFEFKSDIIHWLLHGLAETDGIKYKMYNLSKTLSIFRQAQI